MRYYITRVGGLLLFASALAWITWVLVGSGEPDSRQVRSSAVRPAPAPAPSRPEEEAQPQMSMEAILAAGREPARFESEFDTDQHAQRYAAARMLANDALAGRRGENPAAVLRRLRTVIYAWDDEVISTAGYQARGGTLYAHAGMRATASIEDFLLETLPELPVEKQPARQQKLGDALLRRIAMLQVETFGEDLPPMEFDDRQRELDTHKAALVTAWLNLERELQLLPAPLAERCHKRAVAVYDQFLSD